MGMYLLLGLVYILLVVTQMLKGPEEVAAQTIRNVESEEQEGLIGAVEGQVGD